jgi:hypothetical protein
MTAQIFRAFSFNRKYGLCRMRLRKHYDDLAGKEIISLLPDAQMRAYMQTDR